MARFERVFGLENLNRCSTSEQELCKVVNLPLTGKVPGEDVAGRPMRVTDEVIARFRAIEGLSGTVADALDELGINGAVGTTQLVPTLLGQTIVGRAVTVRNLPQVMAPGASAAQRMSRMAEIEGHNQAGPDDVLVIEGVAGASNMGGISCTIGKRQGEVGAIVDGGIRDIDHSRSIGFPVWATEVTPVTGKWRGMTVAVNHPVTIAEVHVNPGDLVVADGTGVCFVPAAEAKRVLELSEDIASGEARRMADIKAGVPVHELAQRTYVYQYAELDESAPELDGRRTQPS